MSEELSEKKKKFVVFCHATEKNGNLHVHIIFILLQFNVSITQIQHSKCMCLLFTKKKDSIDIGMSTLRIYSFQMIISSVFTGYIWGKINGVELRRK